MDQVTGKANVNPLFNTRCTYEIKNLEMLKKEKSRNINQITKQQHQKRKLTKKLKTMKTEISKLEIYENKTKIKKQQKQK